jgi:hypothetical protein
MQQLYDTTIKRLIAHADKIPSLGGGGKGIKKYLIKYASQVKRDRSIIELGPWLGSATAYICIGIILGGHDYDYHVWDKWEMVEPFISRAKLKHGIDFKNSDDIYNLFYKNIQLFGVYINVHRESILDIKWNNNKKIGLYIDDIGSLKNQVDYKMKMLTPAFIPGETILFMMDYYFYETHPKNQYQKQFFDKNNDVFKFIERAGQKCAIFRYIGEEIKTPPEVSQAGPKGE